MKAGQKRGLKGWIIALILIVFSLLLSGSYWMYQNSIGQAVCSTTVSYMNQIADHDHINILNQMNSKWEYLDSILASLRSSGVSTMEDAVYSLGIGVSATDFERLYLVTDEGRVFSNSYLEAELEAELEEMPWKNYYSRSEGRFVTDYRENNREQWGEYLVYGTHLKDYFTCGNKKITGIVGLVPISEIGGQMRMESFDGQGIAVVMRPTGEIITSSQYYKNGETQNFLTELEAAEFKNGVLAQSCREAVEKGERLFTEYTLNGEGFYVLFQPMEHHGGNDWYLVVRVSTDVTMKQIRELVVRSVPFFFLLGAIVLSVTYFVYHSITAAQIARASEEAKSTFLTNMSHEIRTPLNGIIGLQYLMRQNLDDPRKLEQYLTKAEASADFLKSVITDVLDMSKIESGQIEIYRREMDLSVMLEELEMMLGIQAAEKRLCFRVDSCGLTCAAVLGDALRVKQVLANLLGNAFKFTPEGGEVLLKVTQEREGDTADTTFIVADTGTGMSSEFMEQIWEPFAQERRIASQNGTGLGTTLSKTLVEKMGGSIAVESRMGVGTTFTIRIPFTIVEAPEAGEASSGEEPGGWSLEGKRILVAEDNEINRMIVVAILEERGCLLMEAANGKEALEAFADSSEDYFQLILMDIQMPVMDGHEATRLIRALPRSDSKRVPIFAMTANAFQEDVDKALQCGMDDVVTKPLDIKLLLEKIKNLRDQGQRGD